MSFSSGFSQVMYREVRFGEIRYDFCVGTGSKAWRELKHRLSALDADRFVVVADKGLPAARIAEVEEHFSAIAPTVVMALEASENTKRLATIDRLAERAILGGATRQSCVVGLGGGVIGNLAGLLAGLLYRGIRLVHLPTTLLGMSDSVLSAKQAVNSGLGKNHLGVFHPPVLVWNQLDFLDTLPAQETQAALCETIKNVLCICPARYDELAASLRSDARYSANTIIAFIELSIEAKTQVMRDDPYEKRDGLILEYGHTVGHAAELLSGGRLRHGFAVGVGMLAAARISVLLGYLDRQAESAHRLLLERNGALTALPEPTDITAVLRMIRLDNKRGYVRPRPDRYDFILLDGLGRAHRGEQGLISQVDENVVRAGIGAVQFPGLALGAV
jgi:3-dehydroquinate synthase/2-deoxy-scyllo-inosose synthase